METSNLFFVDTSSAVVAKDRAVVEPSGEVRLRRADRTQAIFETLSLEERLPADHEARVIWAVVERLDVSAFLSLIKARGSSPGAPAIDPRLMIGVILLGAVQGFGSARRLDKLCRTDDGYRWMLGGVTVNYHDLAEFKVTHEQRLDDLLTQLVARLVHSGVVKVKRISQDGVRIRACAGRGSFRRRVTLEKLLEQAKQHVEELKRQSDEPVEESRKTAARARAAREKLERVEKALAGMPDAERVKQNHTGKQSRNHEARVSTTDAEARKMKIGTGAIVPAWNVQLATDTDSRAIVGVTVGNSGSDGQYLVPMREQVEERTGQKVDEHLADGGYFNKDAIEQSHDAGVMTFIPPVKEKDPAKDPSLPKPGDKAGTIELRKRMVEEASKQIYKQRAATSETVNADLTANRGMGRILVRGANKVRCLALWSALAYNIMHLAGHLT